MDVEVIYILLVLFFVMLSMFVGNYILDDVNDDIQSDEDMGNQTKIMMAQSTSDYPLIMDNAFMIIFVLGWIVILIAASMVETHPVFIIISVILLTFVVVVAASLGNVYEDINSDGEFSNFGDSFPKADYVLDNVVLFFFLMSVSVVIVLYGKRRFSG